MLIVRITGGLGNQLFQYAYALSLSNQGYDVKICSDSFDKYKLREYNLEYYNISLDRVSNVDTTCKNNLFKKIMTKLGFSLNNELIEKGYFYEKSMLQPEDNKCISGYFQSEKYFFDIRSILLKEFTLKSGISEYGDLVVDNINQSSCSCSLHIRRGDYLANSATNKIHGVLGLDYYKKAVKLLEEKQGDVQYFIFSDDVQWAKENLNIENAFFIDGQEERIPNEDLYLMSLCNHNIIANSTFSWWGAWLNDNDKKVVISPKQWFMDKKMNNNTFDLIPSIWIRV